MGSIWRSDRGIVTVCADIVVLGSHPLQCLERLLYGPCARKENETPAHTRLHTDRVLMPPGELSVRDLGDITRDDVWQIVRAHAMDEDEEERIGSTSLRRSIYTLLDREQQRLLFLSVAQEQRSWRVLLAMFGTPPYYFLFPDDAQGLSAKGLSLARTRVAFDSCREIASYWQFGSGHMMDENGRLYNVISNERQTAESQPLFIKALLGLTASGHRRLLVRVQKYTSHARRSGMRKTDPRFVIPSKGSTLELSSSTRGMRLVGLSLEGVRTATHTVRICDVFRDATLSQTAIVTCVVLSVVERAPVWAHTVR